MKTLKALFITAVSVASLSLALSGCATKSDHMGYSAPASHQSPGGHQHGALLASSPNATRGSEQMENFRNPAEKTTNLDRGSQSNK
jgi:Flp pilus assembly protein TadD